jgi:hypothetical protein
LVHEYRIDHPFGVIPSFVVGPQVHGTTPAHE